MFKRRYVFGVISLAVSAVGISACSGGGSNNNPNPCANTAYNSAYNNGYINNGMNNGPYNNGINPAPYNNGVNNGAYYNGNCAGAYNNGLNRGIVPNQQFQNQNNVAQVMQQVLARYAAEADATQSREELNREKRSHRRHSNDDPSDSSDSNSGSSNDSVTVIPPSSSSVRVVVAAVPVIQAASAPLATAPVAQAPVAQAQTISAQSTQGYQGVYTPPTGGSVINQPVVASSSSGVQTYPVQFPQAQAAQIAPPAAAVSVQQFTNTDTSTATDNTAQQQTNSVSYAPVPAAIPVEAAAQSIAPAAAQPQGPATAAVTLVPAHTLSANTINQSALVDIMSYINISKNDLAVQWTDSYTYETKLSQSTALQLPAVKDGKKKYVYHIEHTPYVPYSDNQTDLWAYAQSLHLCDIESSPVGACIVLERDTRSGMPIDRAYMLGGFRNDTTTPASTKNYQVVREELPAAVR